MNEIKLEKRTLEGQVEYWKKEYFDKVTENQALKEKLGRYEKLKNPCEICLRNNCRFLKAPLSEGCVIGFGCKDFISLPPDPKPEEPKSLVEMVEGLKTPFNDAPR